MSPPRATTSDDASFVILRTFNAPVGRVFRLWTEPALVAQWWGVRGCTIPLCSLDVRVGGRWRIDMLTARGNLYRNEGVYRQVEKDAYLEYTDVAAPEIAEWAGNPPGDKIHAVSFAADGDVTHVSLEVSFATPADRERLLAFGMRRGWLQSFDRLAQAVEPAGSDRPTTEAGTSKERSGHVRD